MSSPGSIPGMGTLSENIKAAMQKEAELKGGPIPKYLSTATEPYNGGGINMVPVAPAKGPAPAYPGEDPRVTALRDTSLTSQQRAAMPAPDYFAPLNDAEKAYLKTMEGKMPKVTVAPEVLAQEAAWNAAQKKKAVINKTPKYNRPASSKEPKEPMPRKQMSKAAAEAESRAKMREHRARREDMKTKSDSIDAKKKATAKTQEVIRRDKAEKDSVARAEHMRRVNAGENVPAMYGDVDINTSAGRLNRWPAMPAAKPYTPKQADMAKKYPSVPAAPVRSSDKRTAKEIALDKEKDVVREKYRKASKDDFDAKRQAAAKKLVKKPVDNRSFAEKVKGKGPTKPGTASTIIANSGKVAIPAAIGAIFPTFKKGADAVLSHKRYLDSKMTEVAEAYAKPKTEKKK